MIYGSFWQNCDESWYTLIYGHLEAQHKAFKEWTLTIEFDDILEVGCGSGLYANFFSPRKPYTGVDISYTAIQEAQKIRHGIMRRFQQMDYIDDTTLQDKKFDLVFSHSVIDHVYDINKFLLKLYQNTRKHLWVTCYNGFSDDIEQHKYEPYDGYYINRVSIKEITRILAATGSYFDIYPLTYNPQKEPATIIKVSK